MINKIKNLVNKCGIEDVGFCKFSEVKENLFSCRAKNRLPVKSKSIILLLFPYKVHDEAPEKISRYAAVPDYHRVCNKYLIEICKELKGAFTENSFEWFIDNSPIPEVYAAACAGLGVIGENGLLINKRWGSWCFIGEIVTDLEIPCKKYIKKCLMCGNCKIACPRGVHGTNCLSSVSQQKKELTNHEIFALKENNIIWGCDICANVCPMNKNKEVTYIKEFIDGYRNCYIQGENISGRAYEWRGEKIVRRNYNIVNNE